jgi:ubiquinone/menaquinone biosynthesis C-methylase UbiE
VTLRFDAAAAQRIETSYLTPDVVEQRRQVIAALALQPDESVLDIGCGPGLLAVEMAAVAGPDGKVEGTDISPSMLALAAARALPADAAPVEFHRAGVDALPFPDDSFDAAVSTQVLEYVEDIPGALAEMRRVLRPGGRALVLDTDWDSIVWHSSDIARMQRVLSVWDQHLVDPHLPRTCRAPCWVPSSKPGSNASGRGRSRCSTSGTPRPPTAAA